MPATGWSMTSASPWATALPAALSRAAHLAERHVHRQEPCRSCWARYLCGGGCYHEVDRRGRVACDYIRGWLAFCMAGCAEIWALAPENFAAPERLYPPKARPATREDPS